MKKKINPMTYRKKFRCASCNDYSLFITDRFYNGMYIECSNGCEVLESKFLGIIEENDYCGFYKTEEIKANFHYFDVIEESAEVLFKYKLIGSPYEGFSKKQQRYFQNIQNHTFNYNNKLDDLAIVYMGENNLNEIEDMPSPFGYIFSLIEEIEYIRVQIIKNLVMYKFVEKHNNHPLTIRFLMANNFEYIIQIDEKMIVLLGILSNYPFESDLKKNKSHSILKHVKQNATKISNLYQAFSSYHSDGFLNTQRKKRNANSHAESDLMIWLNNNKEKMMEFNYNDLAIDIEMYHNDISKILKLESKIFEFEKELMTYMTSAIEQSISLTKTPMQAEQESDFALFPSEPANSYNPKEIEASKNELFFKLNLLTEISSENQQVVGDVFFRIDEVSRLIIASYKFEEYFLNRYPDDKLDDLINEEELLYSAVNRLCSCFDKLAQYVNSKYNTGNDIKYFEDFRSYKQKITKIDNQIQNILNDSNYLYLTKIRNYATHTMRWGKIYTASETNYFYNPLFNCLTECLNLLVELLTIIVDNQLLKYTKQK
ncbi:hypothetical protein [Trichococcus pasteurii]|uniref:Uncharacterized protein n=1 Tax=Trichococcus pasteurii TaxID=43064 RepID=A0A1W1II97_9LACT|nr:hypothetical protein [Trichococcus pasteurii]SFF12124.1 hypothetical protein SAMN04488086_1323 [Trichococcus pasteurii]SLM52720.1 Hypothetical protein TPAS_2427 [Trichococcus pasteurii]SSB93601.1 Hypothetical protein TPAS_2427 [Trichococcus pasteurii]